MNFFVISIYCLALLAQIGAAILALRLFFRAEVYRLGFGLLAIGFIVMNVRRAYPILLIYEGGEVEYVDAFAALIISLTFFFGALCIQNIFFLMEERSTRYEHDAKVDFLTGLLNRKETDSRIALEINRSFREGVPLAFVMFDIDHFKLVNDAYGHEVGDVVLRELARHSLESLRSIDVLGRFGGEEFLIVMPNTSQKQAFEVSERLRLSVENHICAVIDGREIKITISLGVAVLYPEREDVTLQQELCKKYIDLADQAMYQAKLDGRNRVCCWQEEGHHSSL